MIDTDKYEGHTEGPWTAEYGDYTTHVTNSDGVVVASVGFELDKDGQLIADAPLILEAYKRLRKQYTELREALVGDSPNWTHEELIEQALELSKPAELEFGEWHTDEGDEEE